MAKDERPNRADKLREAIESKLQQKAAAREPAPPPRRAEPGAPPPRPSALDTAALILRTEVSLRGPRLPDLAHMCRQLATLINVGIPLLRALRILSQRTRHPKLRQVMHEAAEDVERGSTLSASFARHPKIMPPLITNIIRIGETGGILEGALLRLADIYERKADLKRKVLAAVAYPVAALTVAVIVLLLIFAYAIPVFENVYTQKEGAQLPDITLTVLAISNFVRFWWPIYIPLLLALIVLAYLWGQTPSGRRFYDAVSLRLPVFGGLNTRVNVARFTRTLAALLSAGIPLMEALSATAESSDNVVVAKTLMDTRATVEAGGKLEDALRQSRVIPPIVTDMIAIGDEGGALDTMLDRMADTYEGEVDAAIKGLVALIEPLLIIFLGLCVIIIALAVLLPYWNIGEIIE